MKKENLIYILSGLGFVLINFLFNFETLRYFFMEGGFRGFNTISDLISSIAPMFSIISVVTSFLFGLRFYRNFSSGRSNTLLIIVFSIFVLGQFIYFMPVF